MEEILQKLDDMIRDMYYHNCEYDSELYGGLTYGDIINLALMVRKNIDTEKEYYIDYMCINTAILSI